MDAVNRYAIDIETTGLDPASAEVTTVAIHGVNTQVVFDSSREALLLGLVEHYIDHLPLDAVLLSWNGEEFDFPFLATRYAILGLGTSMRLAQRGEVGKYGKPLHYVTWAGRSHLDIAPAYKHEAERLGVKWSLKPVAEALGLCPIVEDAATIHLADSERRQAYCLSDARVTYELGRRLYIGGEVN